MSKGPLQVTNFFTPSVWKNCTPQKKKDPEGNANLTAVYRLRDKGFEGGS